MKYIQPTIREAIYMLSGIVLSGALVGIYAQKEIQSANWRTAKAQVGLSRLASEIESIDDPNEVEIASLKSLARAYTRYHTTRNETVDSTKIKP